MKTIKKSFLVAGAVAAAGLGSLGAVGMASADTGSTGRDSIIDKLTTKFKLSKDEVKAVFEEERTARQAEHQQQMKDRLAQAVKDGKLTQTQADKITAKAADMHTYMESLKDKTPEERRTAMEAKREELKQWATDNGIPEDYFPMRGHGPGGQRMGNKQD